MKWTYLILLIVVTMSNYCCQTQSKSTMENNNPLLCNPDSGVCEMPVNHLATPQTDYISDSKKPIKVIYYTDPICSSCWGIEPQLRKLKLEYGNAIEIEYKMGGLLPDWSYNSGGISKPSDVAHHWDEVSVYYDMPIDGNVWLEDPLPSSYPPSIAFKAAQLQDDNKAISFLRVIREMVFLQKKNIAKWENIEQAAKQVGLNIEQLKKDDDGKAKTLFNEDLALARELGVRGFPTMFFIDTTGKMETVYGSKPYESYEQAITKLLPNVAKHHYNANWEALFAIYITLTAKEFSVLSNMPRKDAEDILNKLSDNGMLLKSTTKNGSIWTLNLNKK